MSEQLPPPPTAVVIPQPMTAQEVKTWSILAQFAFVISYAIPLSGFIAVLLIYLILGKRDENMAENARRALNLEIFVFIAGLILASLIFLLPLMGAGIGYALFKEVGAAGLGMGALTIPIAGITLLALYHFIVAILNAVAINRGQLAPHWGPFEFVRKGALL